MSRAKFILGTVQFGLEYGINNLTGRPNKNQIREILNLAYAHDISILDTAPSYGVAYNEIATFHSFSNIRFKINTKFKYERNTDICIKRQVEDAISKLLVNKIDTLFFHNFDDFINYPNLITEIENIKKDGLINKIGVSIYDNTEFKAAVNNSAIDSIQLPYNLLDNYSQRGEYLRVAKDKNKEIQIRSVFLQGLFLKDISRFPSYLNPLKKYINKLNCIASKMSLSVEELALKYVLSEPLIDYVIIGVDTKSQLEKNLKSFEGDLDINIKSEIDSIRVTEQSLLYPINWK